MILHKNKGGFILKKEYTTPELEVMVLRLSKDILGDSKPESSDNPIYATEIDPNDDPFA